MWREGEKDSIQREPKKQREKKMPFIEKGKKTKGQRVSMLKYEFHMHYLVSLYIEEETSQFSLHMVS